MSSKKVTLVIVASIVAAFVGGMMGVWLFMPTPVQAQDAPSFADKLTVRELQLVDKDGNLQGLFDYDEELGTLLMVGDVNSNAIYLRSEASGSSHIGINNAEGNQCVGLASNEDEAALFLESPASSSSSALELGVHSTSSFARLRDHNGTVRAALMADNDSTFLAFTDMAGDVSWVAP